MESRRVQIKHAFEELKYDEGGVKFGRVVVRLLAARFPDIKPFPPHNDQGQDALASKDGRVYRFLCSFDSRLHKIKDDCVKLKKAGHRTDVVVFCTWPKVTGAKQEEWHNTIKKEFGWDLHVYEEESILHLALLDENVSAVAEDLKVQPHPSYRQPPAQIVASPVENELIKHIIEKAVLLRNNWKLNESITEFKNALDKYSHSISNMDKARINTNLAAAYADIGEFRLARKYSRVARGLAPDDVRVRTNRVVIEMACGHFLAARRIWKIEFRDFQPDAKAYGTYANILWAMRNDAKAMEHVERGIALDDRVSELHALRGVMLREQRSFDQALMALHTACELDSQNYFARGILLETRAYLANREGCDRAELDKLDRESAAWLHEVMHAGSPLPTSLRPAAASLWQAQGLTLEAKKDGDAAIAAFKEAIALKNDPIFWMNLGMVHVREGRAEDADNAFRKSLELGGTDPFLYNNIAVFDLHRYRDHGDVSCLAEAKRYVAVVKRALPDNPETTLLEGCFIIAESNHQQRDIGIGRAKALFQRVFTDKTVPEQMAIQAHKNYQDAEQLAARLEQMTRRSNAGI